MSVNWDEYSLLQIQYSLLQDCVYLSLYPNADVFLTKFLSVYELGIAKSVTITTVTLTTADCITPSTSSPPWHFHKTSAPLAWADLRFKASTASTVPQHPTHINIFLTFSPHWTWADLGFKADEWHQHSLNILPISTFSQHSPDTGLDKFEGEEILTWVIWS